MSEMKQSHLRAVRLVKFVCDELQKKEREEEMDSAQDFFIPENSTAILHLAVEHGVFELVEKCLKAFTALVDKQNGPVPAKVLPLALVDKQNGETSFYIILVATERPNQSSLTHSMKWNHMLLSIPSILQKPRMMYQEFHKFTP